MSSGETGPAHGIERVVTPIRAATVVRDPDTTDPPARFALIVDPSEDPAERAGAIGAALAPVGARVAPLSRLNPQILVLEIAERTFSGEDGTAFAAAYALADVFHLDAAEPDLPTRFPEPPPGRERELLPSGCQAPREDALDATPMWALDSMRVRAAWAFSEAAHRPDRGASVIVAQPDTGITHHTELDGILNVPGFDVLDHDNDPTDPLIGGFGNNPGHGTGTASVLVSQPPGRVTGSAPKAEHMAIRAITSVVQITQFSVTEAMDWAVQHGAHIITLSLGGVPSLAQFGALRQAVQADVIVLAAAGNCIGNVVWPARYADCIAVAGTDVRDAPWRGTSHGPAVDVSAPGENVFHATVPTGSDQGQGTSFSVALTAGVVALWLAHHGRANLIAAAHARGETLAGMCRRLLAVTARRPAGWNTAEMGAGIVDANALLAADFGLGFTPHAMAAPLDPRDAAAHTVKSLVTEILGPEAAGDELDWYRYGPEIATALLRRRLDALPPDAPDAGPAPMAPAPAPTVSPELAQSITNPSLRAALGLP